MDRPPLRRLVDHPSHLPAEQVRAREDPAGLTAFERTSPVNGTHPLPNGRSLPRLSIPEGGTSLEEMRHATERDLPALHGPLQEVAAVRMFSVTADDGHEIRIRGYWPTESRQADAPLPAIVMRRASR